MAISVAIFTTPLDAVDAAVATVPSSLPEVKGLDDDSLLEVQRRIGDARHALDAVASLVAGEVAFRSRPDLGYRGLAQKNGFSSPQKLVQSATGSTGRDASTLVTVGAMVHEARAAELADPETGELPPEYRPAEPWLAAAGAAVASGELSVEAARAIRTGLGEPSVDAAGVGVSADDLTGAVIRLLAEATGVNADRMLTLARRVRDELDAAGIATRERLIYEQRSFRRSMRPNGLPRYTIDPDIETAAYLDDLYDKLTSPRRNGPRFVDPEDQAWAQNVIDDARTNEQYLHDAFAGLIRLGVSVDQGGRQGFPRIVGSRTPAVRVLVTETALSTGAGAGRIEGTGLPVSIDTVNRIVCDAGILPIRFSETDDVVALGREERLFTGRQKIALAARDGGCVWPDCDRPPSWTEAHHINQWGRDRGNTDLCDGVLLCRYHHMLLHNNHWEIERRGSEYWLHPPPDAGVGHVPRRLAFKSAALRDLQRERARKSERPRKSERQLAQA
ncbi:hypothetical protein BKA04_001697 [Cryobacterium mesophilum]|uniref:HNH endonuclease n=1 Tax=Terrimesophilobacter mesophilus TaxID=433647 RepID=A0A4R8VEB3_9MICO|nr:HNH endonuclease signature motif containing protein [Terrimesophilobacter mesophilus]MBB5633474.1 hypothetical protein [Terrimesophilobacter mesophilus]TFB80187.1 HNH endonuclease [Terrimesophilobacter mesophilus]